ncbi:MAG: DNA polymerase III subunit delta' [bacterium]|nr:DNA polymerase III subunit delta' [bacterium]
MNEYLTQWNQIQTAFFNKRMPQALLLVGPLHCALNEFVSQLIPLFLCSHVTDVSCSSCIDCNLAKRMEHPDVEWIKPEKSGGAIKIDQIRELQSSAYLTPQRAKHRIIIIDAADRMNIASANALLKILEEPAGHLLFILIAQQISTVLPTILSRCQMISFSLPNEVYSDNLLMLGTQYSDESERSLIINNTDTLLDELISLIERKQHPCMLASQWIKFELVNILWFLYLVYSQLQNMHFNKKIVTGLGNIQLSKLEVLLDPILIFIQIDKINTLLRKISHNMNINNTLALEDLLLSLVPES